MDGLRVQPQRFLRPDPTIQPLFVRILQQFREPICRQPARQLSGSARKGGRWLGLGDLSARGRNPASPLRREAAWDLGRHVYERWGHGKGERGSRRRVADPDFLSWVPQMPPLEEDLYKARHTWRLELSPAEREEPEARETTWLAAR